MPAAFPATSSECTENHRVGSVWNCSWAMQGWLSRSYRRLESGCRLYLLQPCSSWGDRTRSQGLWGFISPAGTSTSADRGARSKGAGFAWLSCWTVRPPTPLSMSSASTWRSGGRVCWQVGALGLSCCTRLICHLPKAMSTLLLLNANLCWQLNCAGVDLPVQG